MSAISTSASSVLKYDPKTSKAFTGQRLSKVTFKTSNDKSSEYYGVKRESKCVSLEPVSVQDVVSNVTALAPAVVEFLQGVQDKIVRERVEAGALHVSVDEVSIAACVEWLETQDESGRLTKESVGTWFASEIEEGLALILADKLGVSEIPTAEQSAQVLRVVGSFKDKVSSLAGGKTSYEPKLCESLKKVLELAPAGDALAARFTGRLDKMIAASKSAEDLMNLL